MKGRGPDRVEDGEAPGAVMSPVADGGGGAQVDGAPVAGEGMVLLRWTALR